MRNFCFALLLLIFQIGLVFSQSSHCPEDTLLRYKVTSPNGIVLRKEADQNTAVIKKIPSNQELFFCKHATSVPATINGVSGHWLNISYEGSSGYVFDGNLEKLPLIDLIQPYNYTWDEDVFPLDFAKGYYSIEKLDSSDQFLRTKVKIRPEKIRVKDSVGSILNRNKIAFIISGIAPPKRIDGIMFDAKSLFPGDMMKYNIDTNHYMIYAKGDIIKNVNSNELNPYSGINNYELRVRKITNGIVSDQLVYKMDLGLWVTSDYLGGISLNWIGDIDGDRLLDLVFSTSSHHECYETHLFLSSKAERNYLMREVFAGQYCW